MGSLLKRSFFLTKTINVLYVALNYLKSYSVRVAERCSPYIIESLPNKFQDHKEVTLNFKEYIGKGIDT